LLRKLFFGLNRFSINSFSSVDIEVYSIHRFETNFRGLFICICVWVYFNRLLLDWENRLRTLHRIILFYDNVWNLLCLFILVHLTAFFEINFHVFTEITIVFGQTLFSSNRKWLLDCSLLFENLLLFAFFVTILLRSLCLTLRNGLLLFLRWSLELNFHEFNWKLRWCTLTFHQLIDRRLLWRRLSIYRFFDVSAEISQINWLLLRSSFFIRYLISIDVIVPWSFWLILYAFCCWKLRSRTISIDLSHLQLYFLKRFVNFNRFFYLQKGRVVRHQSVVLFKWQLLWLLDI